MKKMKREKKKEKLALDTKVIILETITGITCLGLLMLGIITYPYWKQWEEGMFYIWGIGVFVLFFGTLLWIHSKFYQILRRDNQKSNQK